MNNINKKIQSLVNNIVEQVHPLRIIIFGSAARGDFKTDSDIDVMVIMPEGTHRRKTSQFLYRNIRGRKIPFDILVATPSDLEKHKNNEGLIYSTVLKEGLEVYAVQ